MKFEKRNFMGIELDVLVGHPEHELLFVASQVGRAAGLKAPSESLSIYLKANNVSDGVLRAEEVLKVVKDVPNRRAIQRNTWLTTESVVYKMLLASVAPQTEPFRKWVTEEVLPTIRKTGRYDAEQSDNPIAMELVDRIKSLEGVIESQGAKLSELCLLVSKMSTGHAEAVKSPYEGVTKSTVHYQLKTRKEGLRKAAETIGLNVLKADKYAPRVALRIEAALVKLWASQDDRLLETETSTQMRVWTQFPTPWLVSHLTHDLFRETYSAVINEIV